MNRSIDLCVLATCASLAALSACGESTDILRYEPPDIVGDAVSYGIWTPSGTDTCSQAVHDQYYAVAPDGLRYPTWHPAVDPSGCTFDVAVGDRTPPLLV